MRTTFVLPLLLSLASASTFGQSPSLCPRGPEVRTVATNMTMRAGTAIGGMAVDAQGRMYSATFREKVFRIDRDGTVRILTSSFVRASGNTIDNGGELLQSEYALDQLYRVHEDGSRTLITDVGLDGPVGVVMDRSGIIFVVNYLNDTIARIAPDGTTSLFSDDPLLNGPNGIIIDDAGEMYVANLKDNLLLRIDATGTASLVAAIGPLGPFNNAHVAACGGKLYVSSIFRHRIYEVTPAGDVKLIAGNGAPGVEDGFMPHARLVHPNGIATGPGGKVLYTNNYVGPMGWPNSTLVVRTIHLE